MKRINFVKYFEGHAHMLKYNVENEVISTYQIEIINKSEQKNFLKIDHNQAHYLSYDITSLIPVDTYFKNYCDVFTRVKSLFIAFVEVLEGSQQYLLNLENFMIEDKYCFYDLELQTLKLIYLPTSVGHTRSIHDKMRELFLNLLIRNVDMTYISSDKNYVHLVEQLQVSNFDIYVFKKLLELYVERENEVCHPTWISKIFKSKPKKISMPEMKAEFTIESDMTIALDTIEKFPALEFIDSRKISISKKKFLIGRSSHLVDYSLPEALTLGRVHAEIIQENFIYFIMDHNTKNGTYINGVKLTSQKKYKLEHNDEIKFADKIAYFRY